jgi:hypothetical protein
MMPLWPRGPVGPKEGRRELHPSWCGAAPVTYDGSKLLDIKTVALGAIDDIGGGGRWGGFSSLDHFDFELGGGIGNGNGAGTGPTAFVLSVLRSSATPWDPVVL